MSACGPTLTSVCSNYIKTTEKNPPRHKLILTENQYQSLCLLYNPKWGVWVTREGMETWCGRGGLHLPGPETLRPNRMWKRLTSSRRQQDCKETMKAQIPLPRSGQIQHQSCSSTEAVGSCTGSSHFSRRASNEGSQAGSLVGEAGGGCGGTPPC